MQQSVRNVGFAQGNHKSRGDHWILSTDATRQVWSVGIEGGDTFLKYG